MTYIGRIDKKLYSVVSEITTDEVIITDEQIRHIKERHGDNFDDFLKYLPEILSAPDYIIRDDKYPNTALILKEIISEDKRVQVVLRLHTLSDVPEYKNSIISFWEISRSRWENYLRNKKVLYKRE